jgi:ammonium transporter, Amt family
MIRWMFSVCLASAALAGFATFVILKFVNAAMGLRVTAEDEDSRLDLTQHGESAYND